MGWGRACLVLVGTIALVHGLFGNAEGHPQQVDTEDTTTIPKGLEESVPGSTNPDGIYAWQQKADSVSPTPSPLVISCGQTVSGSTVGAGDDFNVQDSDGPDLAYAVKHRRLPGQSHPPKLSPRVSQSPKPRRKQQPNHHHRRRASPGQALSRVPARNQPLRQSPNLLHKQRPSQFPLLSPFRRRTLSQIQ
eukprot:c9946_g2_i1.p1 GENE.c9946_g2_i1~~c9946_g2_i1.p1  ORF type:complete len:202 (+),score=0.84 c9946_g2_i1:35-607(+)